MIQSSSPRKILYFVKSSMKRLSSSKLDKISSPGYHFSIWQGETSILGHVPDNAIKLIR